ncbi:hypothetical protein BG55_03815 [Erwinia mallotivora]|uniref:Toxin YafO n=2 Tax=Erwinia mallotivora TaxID=69222 RepID=A0A014NBM0_9GAMM|nr:hypothetical protein BG55_03815 [Erwinia mallotivora]
MKGFVPVYDEFKIYKLSSKTHSRPTNKYQKEFFSISPLFGRDRFNADDSMALELSAENLTHVHVKQKSCIWVDEDGDPLVQWECKSNAYLIYSYFVHKATRYYFVVNFIDNNAHASWDNEDAKKLWLEDAKAFRLSVISL